MYQWCNLGCKYFVNTFSFSQFWDHLCVQKVPHYMTILRVRRSLFIALDSNYCNICLELSPLYTAFITSNFDYCNNWVSLYYGISYIITVTKANYKSEPTKVTTYLTLEAELWALFCEGFADNWLCYNATTLFMSLNVINHGPMLLLKPNLGIFRQKFFIIFLFYYINFNSSSTIYDQITCVLCYFCKILSYNIRNQFCQMNSATSASWRQQAAISRAGELIQFRPHHDGECVLRLGWMAQ